MLVFIDESGDPGFKVESGSSPAFVLGMVVFDTVDASKSVSAAIADLAQKHRIYPEFKFSKSRPDIKDAFFEAVNGFDFKVRAIVVRKDNIRSEHLRRNRDSFYSYFTKNMLRFDNGLLKNARIIIDGSGERVFKNELSSYLRKNTEQGAIKSIRFSDSRSDPLVQLADMCTGAIARSYRDNRTDAFRWRQMLRNQIQNVWEFK